MSVGTGSEPPFAPEPTPAPASGPAPAPAPAPAPRPAFAPAPGPAPAPAPAPAPVLPPLLVLTDGAGARYPLVEVVTAAVAGGARALVLREKHLPRAERAALAEELGALLREVGGTLVVASDPTIPAGGVHLAGADPFPVRSMCGAPGLVGRSCHDRAEVARAAAEGCDYATLSPIFESASKPGYGPALGPGALAGHPLPLWALGGIDPPGAAACIRAGAAGVAVMGAVMRAEDPAAAVAAFCDALAAARDQQ